MLSDRLRENTVHGSTKAHHERWCDITGEAKNLFFSNFFACGLE